MADRPTHQIVVQISTEALRGGLDLVERGAYASLDALVDSLLLDEATSGDVSSMPSATTAGRADALTNVLERPPAQPPAGLADSIEPRRGTLQFLTNRLSPLKVSARVLANLAGQGEWPELNAFQIVASRAAREVGLRLRAEDREAGRRGAAKRFVGYPVGDDQDAALGRFAFSFTINGARGEGGPLSVLGLAHVVDGRATLTEPGWHLAAAPNPLLDGGKGLLADKEIDIFKARLRAAPDERQAVVEFLGAVHRAAGSQSRVDELLATAHPDWSSDHAAAHRSAMLGRLGELGVLRISGRGRQAHIELLDTDGLRDGQGGTA